LLSKNSEILDASLHKKLKGHKGSVYCIVYDQNQHKLYSAGGDGWIVSWHGDSEDGVLIADVTDQVFSLCLSSPDLILAGSMQGDLYFIHQRGVAPPRKKVFHQKGIFAIAEHKGKILTAGGDGRLGIWNQEQAELEESIVLSDQRLRCLSLSPDKQNLALGSSDGNIYFLHTNDWGILKTIKNPHESSVFNVFWRDQSNIN
jgi:WD40 repeat protein